MTMRSPACVILLTAPSNVQSNRMLVGAQRSRGLSAGDHCSNAAASARMLDALCIPAHARDLAALAIDPALSAIRVDNPTPVFPRLEMPVAAA